MDDPLCDQDLLIHTYQQFSVINSAISGWKRIYKEHIKPFCSTESRCYSVLDIGFGGGDIPLKLAQWAAQDKIALEITAIETDARAVAFAKTLNAPVNIHFEEASSTDILRQKRRFDFVLSNHLLHHLSPGQLKVLLEEAQKLCTHQVLFNDIERSDWGYLLFNLLARPVFRDSFIAPDGITSIKRSYTAAELTDSILPDWRVQQRFPFRLLLSYEAMNEGS